MMTASVLTVHAVQPTAVANASQYAALTGTVTSVDVPLDGSQSYDVDGTVKQYAWTLAGSVIATGPTAVVNLPLGTHPITLTVTDNTSLADTDLTVAKVWPGPLYDIFDDAGPAAGWDAGGAPVTLQDSALVLGPTGVYALASWVTTSSWADYTVAAHMTPAATGCVGIAFLLQDRDNYYRLGLQGSTTLILECVTNGVPVLLAEAAVAFSPTQLVHCVVQTGSGRLTVSCDGVNPFGRTITNGLLSAGSVGLLACPPATGVFHDVAVVWPLRPPTVVPVGDSISHGRGTDPQTFSYRYPLWKLFIDKEFPVDFIGTMDGGFNGNPDWDDYKGFPFDLDHEARWGIRPDTVSNYIDGWMATYEVPGDIVLILLGTNGSGDDGAIPRTVESHRWMIQTARKYKPHAVVIIGLAFQEWSPFPAMRQAYRDLAAEMSTPWSPVVTVDHSPGWVSNPNAGGTCTVDWVHPNQKGDLILANNWFPEIARWVPHAVYDPGRPQSPSVEINSGAGTTEDNVVALTLGASNPAPDCMQVSLSSNFVNAFWMTFTNTLEFTLPTDLGEYTVYARFNAGGETSTTASDSIALIPEPGAAAALLGAVWLLARRLLGCTE
jgi:hypothetical protein